MKRLQFVSPLPEFGGVFYTKNSKSRISRLIFSVAIFISIVLCNNNVFAQNPIDGSELAASQRTAGTFQIESPSGKRVYWRIDVIEALYPEIESRRAQTENVIWNYSDDVQIIIFSKEFINDEYFIPLASPYKGLKEY